MDNERIFLFIALAALAAVIIFHTRETTVAHGFDKGDGDRGSAPDPILDSIVGASVMPSQANGISYLSFNRNTWNFAPPIDNFMPQLSGGFL